MKSPSLKHNFMMNALLTMSSFLFPLITFPYVSRILGPAGNGRVAFATSVISYFCMFAQLGIPTYGIRACAKVRDNKIALTRTIQEIFFINMVTSLLTYGVFFVALFTVPQLQADKPLFLIVSSTILFNAIGMEWLYRGLEQYTYITVRSLVFKVIGIVAMFLLVHTKEDYVLYGAVSIFAASASAVCNFFHAHRLIGFRPVGGYQFKRHIKPILVFFAMSCAATVYTNLDTAMLGFMKTDMDVGYYNAAVKIKIILVSIVTSLGTVLLPRASYYAEEGKTDEVLRITKKAMQFVVLVAAPLTLYFMLFARPGILLLSGDAYSGSVLPMQIIMPTLLFIGMTNILGMQILVPLGREKSVLLSTAVGAVVDLILNLLLIPSMSAAGAAIGTVVAEFAVWIVQLILLREWVSAIYRPIRYTPLLLGMAAATVGSIWVYILPLSPFLTLLLSAILFFGIYSGTLLLMKEPLTRELFSQSLSKLKK